MDVEDERLICRFLRGDDDAYAILYRKYVRILFAYGSNFGFDKEDLHDAIQDVFYQVLIKRTSLKNIRNLKYFFIRSLRNRLIDIKRKNVGFETLENEESFSIHFTVLDGLIEKEDQIKLQQNIDYLLSCLSDRQKESIYLRYIQELDYEEIADILSITPHAVEKLVSRAIIKMRSHGLPILFLFYYLRLSLL